MTKSAMRKEERRKRLSDDNGDPSLGRWIVFYGTILSGVLAIVGIFLAIYEVMFQPYILGTGMTVAFHSNVGMPMIMAGVGLYTSGAISKAWQAQAEAKKMMATAGTDPSLLQDPSLGTYSIPSQGAVAYVPGASQPQGATNIISGGQNASAQPADPVNSR